MAGHDFLRRRRAPGATAAVGTGHAVRAQEWSAIPAAGAAAIEQPSLRRGSELRAENRCVDSTARTVEQTEIAQFWGYGPGTATPPGHWNQIAQVVAASEGNSLAGERTPVRAAEHRARRRGDRLLGLQVRLQLLAAHHGHSARRHGRQSRHVADPAWTPLLVTPPFPEYTSGHSTFSGAAAVVLAAFFHRDRVAFTVGSDDLPGVVRFYDSFSEAALESGMSRIYGGIHFMSANLYGLLSGSAKQERTWCGISCVRGTIIAGDDESSERNQFALSVFRRKGVSTKK